MLQASRRLLGVAVGFAHVSWGVACWSQSSVLFLEASARARHGRGGLRVTWAGPRVLDLVSDQGSLQPCGHEAPAPLGGASGSPSSFLADNAHLRVGGVWVLPVCAPASQTLDPREASPSEVGFRVRASWDACSLCLFTQEPCSPGQTWSPGRMAGHAAAGDGLHLLCSGAGAGHGQRRMKTSDRAERKPFAMSP